MDEPLSAADQELYQAVDRIVREVLDPMGAPGVAVGRDEYRTYLPQLFAIVQSGNGLASVAGFLSYVLVSRMGLPENDERDIEVARMLLQQRESIYGRAV